MLHNQNLKRNVLSVGEILWCLSVANATIFKDGFLNYFDIVVIKNDRWTTRMSYVEINCYVVPFRSIGF